MSNLEEIYSKLIEALNAQTTELKHNISQEANKTRDNIKVINSSIIQIKDRIINLERVTRKNNLIVFGLQVDGSDLITNALSKLSQLLNQNISVNDINNLYRLGKNQNAPIKIEFLSYLKKTSILQCAKNLKGSNVFLNNDLCAEDREAEKNLRENLKKARSKGYKAIIKNRKLIINNEELSQAQLNEIFEQKSDGNTDTIESNSEDHTENLFSNNSAPSTPTAIQRYNSIVQEFYEPEATEESFGQNNQPAKNKQKLEQNSKGSSQKVKTRSGSTSTKPGQSDPKTNTRSTIK